MLRLFVVLLMLATLAACGWLLASRLSPAPPPVAPGGTPSASPSVSPNGSGGGLEGQLLAIYLALRGGDINRPAGSDDTPVAFTVRPGDTTTVIGQRLQAAGLVRDAELFRLYVRSQGTDGKLEAGDYRLRATMSVAEIAALLQHAKAAASTVTLREGLRAEETAEVLAAGTRLATADLLAMMRTGRFDYAVLKDKPTAASLEGYLFPDTYEIAATATPTQVVDLLLKTFDQRFSAAMRQQAAARQQTVFQVLTVASLVEREAQLASERPIIANVYLNRLAKGMALEADSTVQYALGYDTKGKTWWRTLALDDLRRDVGPYSTYLNRGLPPGPICSPGLASIQAVLEPARTDYLYYYAKGDGSHAFARTFEEHQQNMKTYGR
ncbi:MAG: endolytic transglycosylase MltG [Chloroflexota bacterium]|nr:endolytic transglycosylase MltG [Chloroflexota bacterium]